MNITEVKGLNTLLIIGSWNSSIFTPEWVTRYLLDGEELKVEFPVLSSSTSLRFSTSKLVFFIEGNKLIIKEATSETEEEHLRLIEEIGRKIIQMLPHTPISAFGINFAFELELNEQVKQLFAPNDEHLFSQLEYPIINHELKRTFSIENYQLNLTIKLTDKALIYFNYHYNSKDASEFSDLFNESIIKNLKENTQEILTTFFQP